MKASCKAVETLAYLSNKILKATCDETNNTIVLHLLLLTLSAHTQQGLQYSLCLSVCLSVTTILALQATRREKSDTNGHSAT